MPKQNSEEDVLPPEVRAEVEKAKAEEGGDEGEHETESAALPEPEETKESRRQRKEREREEERRAFTERTEKAERIAEEMRAARIADAERLARLESMLQENMQRQQTPQRKDDDDPREVYDKQMKKAKEALAAGNLDEYHDRLSRAMRAQAVAESVERTRGLIPQQQAQQPQKPVWAQAVEAQFPDVVMHANGLNTVASFVQMAGGPAGLNAERLQQAFTRARQELGLVKQTQPDPSRERQRQMLASGSANGGTRPSGGKSERVVNGVPKNYKEIARAAGMTPEAYIKAFATMNPGNVAGRE